MRRQLFVALAVLALSQASCSTTEKDSGGGDAGGGSGGGGSSGGSNGGSAQASSNRVTFINSLSNNSLTSYTVASGKANQQFDRFANGKDRRTLEGRVSTARLARKGVGPVLAAVKRLAEEEQQRGANRTVSDDVKLELALAAIESKNFDLGEYLLQTLTDSKDARVKAGAYNAMGVVALKDDRVPEAVLYFRQALQAVGNYRPARLNLAFAALKGGDMKTAKAQLSDSQGDWFTQYGMISIERMEGDAGRAGDLCDQVLKKEAGHKAALYNCGLVEFQNKRNFAKARELIRKSQSARGGDGWDSRITDSLAEVQIAEQQIRQADAKKKAEEKAAAAAKKKDQQGGNAQPVGDKK